MANQALTALETEVQETLGVQESAITLITGLKQKLDEAIAEQNWPKIQELSNQLDASGNALAAAVAANSDTGGGGEEPEA